MVVVVVVTAVVALAIEVTLAVLAPRDHQNGDMKKKNFSCFCKELKNEMTKKLPRYSTPGASAESSLPVK